jgi:hypothetical protein
MIGYTETDTIKMYVEEYNSLETAVETLQDRQNTIDTILRHEHNFAIGKDRL